MNESESRGRGCVVVGLDRQGEPAGLLEVAADEAQRRAVELAVITVLRPNHHPGLNVQGQRRDDRRAEANALQDLHAVTRSLRSNFPRLKVTTYCLGDGEIGPNREPLLWAQLLVVGTHDRDGRQSLTAGSVSRSLISRSRCPVLVVPDRLSLPDAPWPVRSDRPPLIMVGVSRQPADAAVVRAAYAESIGRNCEVVLVTTSSPGPGEDVEMAREGARAALAEFAGQPPTETRVSVAVVDGEPVPALLRLARTATLLVIGGRTAASAGPATESVSRAVLEAMPCPVLVVPRDLSAVPPGPILGLTLAATAERRQLSV
ncbi:MAG TPA: universal stress protein [Kineosporiaceae bacterium]|nr:universal stress protein [Kineosporiaceae bacterium]